MVTIEALNVVKGEKEMYFEDTTKEERDKLAAEVLALQKKGFAIFLVQGEESRQIKGYDSEAHEWLVLSTARPAPKKAKRERVPARGTKATAVGMVAGG